MAADAGNDAWHAPDTHFGFGDVKVQKEATTHARMGEMVWMFMTAAAVCVAATRVRVAFLRLLFPLLALVAALTVVGWVAVTAQHGGHLVYVHGLGVPHSDNNNFVAPANPPSAKPATGTSGRNQNRLPASTRPSPPATAPQARAGLLVNLAAADVRPIAFTVA